MAGVARTFMSNAGIVQTFGVNDRATAYMLSKTIGDTTIEYETVGTSRGLGWGENRAGRSESTNAHVSARRLATPDEIMRMQSDQLLLLRQGERPLVVEKIRYYNQCEFAGCSIPGERRTKGEFWGSASPPKDGSATVAAEADRD